ncbi:MAG TPA: BlaI/MecI/CopY family transcriptional regulator [Terriglobales bacterium]|nr:BlaI/MecI/CopY family transcriptional regulator [Terriglobales bacterium]
MSKSRPEQLTPLELEVMQVLWQLGESNVQAVQQALSRELAYTTVQTVLNILMHKGRVTRAKRERAFFYTPAVSRSKVTRQAVSDMVRRLFGGSVESLVMTLLETRQLTPEKLQRLQRLVTEAQKKDGLRKDARGRTAREGGGDGKS